MIHGVLNVHKEQGYTSHDVVAKLRGILHQKKIGHTGTLDPDAAGVLPVCLGTATKLCDMLTDETKTYQAVLRLGIVTDTQDMTGKILSSNESIPVEEEVRRVIEGFRGAYDQIPPMYSAIKVGGKKLYELAREGIEIDRKARRVTIFAVKIEECCLPRVRFTVQCSKGTYIRTLCQDIGERLGCGGCMESLLRLQVGRFQLEDSLKLEEIRSLYEEGRLEEALIPVDDMFGQYPAVQVQERYQKLIDNGNPFHADQVAGGVETGWETVRVYNEQGKFYGIYRYIPEEKRYRPVKMFLGD